MADEPAAADAEAGLPKGSPGFGANGRPRLPEWFKVQAPSGQAYVAIKEALRKRGLATVCEEARCPNLAECWSGGVGGVVDTATEPDDGGPLATGTVTGEGGPLASGQRAHDRVGASGTATIMIMGDTCTRGCRFCSVATGRPDALDPEEPQKTSETIGVMGVGYVVITSVDRDDLPDGGAEHFARVVEQCKADHPELLVEVLTPDFAGDETCLQRVVDSGADVIAHNIEAVRRVSPLVRDRRADYDQSLRVLKRYKELGARFTKTSIMVGFGETEDEVRETLQELRDHDVDIVTFGQYLRPTQSPRHLPVVEFVHPDQFAKYKRIAQDMGFLYVASGPLVRSSYKAGELFMQGLIRGENPMEA